MLSVGKHQTVISIVCSRSGSVVEDHVRSLIVFGQPTCQTRRVSLDFFPVYQPKPVYHSPFPVFRSAMTQAPRLPYFNPSNTPFNLSHPSLPSQLSFAFPNTLLTALLAFPFHFPPISGTSPP